MAELLRGMGYAGGDLGGAGRLPPIGEDRWRQFLTVQGRGVLVLVRLRLVLVSVVGEIASRNPWRAQAVDYFLGQRKSQRLLTSAMVESLCEIHNAGGNLGGAGRLPPIGADQR